MDCSCLQLFTITLLLPSFSNAPQTHPNSLSQVHKTSPRGLPCRLHPRMLPPHPIEHFNSLNTSLLVMFIFLLSIIPTRLQTPHRWWCTQCSAKCLTQEMCTNYLTHEWVSDQMISSPPSPVDCGCAPIKWKNSKQGPMPHAYLYFHDLAHST